MPGAGDSGGDAWPGSCGSPARVRIPLDELEWRFTGIGRAGRPAREHLEHPGRGALRRRRLAVARPPPAGPADRAARARRSGSWPPTPGRSTATGSSRWSGCGPVWPTALRVERPRGRPRPTAAARRRRLEAKRRRSEIEARPAHARDRGRLAPMDRPSTSLCSPPAPPSWSWCSTRRSARSCCPRGASCCSPASCGVAVRQVFELVARPAKTYEARDRVMALYGPLALFDPPFVWLVLDHHRVHVHVPCASSVDGWSTAFTRAGRRCSRSGSSARSKLPAPRPRLRRGRVRPRAARPADLVPPDDLRRVLAARGARRPAVGPGRHPARAGRPLRPRAPHRPARRARGHLGRRGSSGSPSSRRRTPRWRSWCSSARPSPTGRGSRRRARCSTPRRS